MRHQERTKESSILEDGVYRIVQEGLANACQHSQSEKMRVSIAQQEARIQVEIRDWGGADSTPNRSRRNALGWWASGKEQDCSAASAESEARRIEEPAFALTCRS